MLYNQIFNKNFKIKFIIISFALILLSFYELFSLLLFPAFILMLTNKNFFFESINDYILLKIFISEEKF